jgi:isoamylase
LQDKHADIQRFLRRLIQGRRSLDVFQENHGLSLSQLLHQAQISWHGVKLDEPDWGYNSYSLAFTVQARRERFHIILNAYKDALEFELPPVFDLPGLGWRRVIDTFLESPDDFCSWRRAPVVERTHYLAQPHSIVVLGLEYFGDE